MGLSGLYNAVRTAVREYALGANTTETGTPQKGKVLPYELKSVSQIRVDIKDWKEAQGLYYDAITPRSYALQNILSDIMKDPLVSSQKENRVQTLLSMDIQLKKANGDVDQEQSDRLKKEPIYRFLTRASVDALFYENSTVELSVSQTIDGRKFLVGDLVPRTNIVPSRGLFYPDYTDDTRAISYRDMPEYGVWILEFWSKEMPLLNKAVPGALMKRFAQSCWSELCEIYGIPPRVLKTNTQDKDMMARATKMMTDMGAASWFIIDEEESFDFAQGATTNGDVYEKLINLCSNEICLLIVGAILAQDTKNGSRSKDDVAKEMLMQLVKADMAVAEEHWNNIIMPALKKHGVVSQDIEAFDFVPVINLTELFDRLTKLLDYYDFDLDWINGTFGMKATAKREQPAITNQDKKKLFAQLTGDSDFFGAARQRKSA